MCGVVFVVWSRAEARRVGIDPWWPFALALAGGVCFAFPLFLGYRELARKPVERPAP
jgi:drug/metabolite transporter (DMT)-like permease